MLTHPLVQAEEHARRLGHRYLGCEHLLLAAAATGEPASAASREQGLTPQAVETQIVRLAGLGQAADLGHARCAGDAAFVSYEIILSPRWQVLPGWPIG